MTNDAGLDVLMITYNRPQYVRLALPRLITTVRPHDRVWVWHNGDDEETLDTVRAHVGGVHRFHHSRENVRLRTPTNWLWTEAQGDWLAKVDDDSLVSAGWVDRLVDAHAGSERFGVLGSWRFFPEDWHPASADRKTVLIGGTKLLHNHWVQGSGYVLRRSFQQAMGPLRKDESWPQWCIRLARKGAVNGWPLPLVLEEHMDDPRSPNTLLVDDHAVRRFLPLSAQMRGVDTLAAWQAQMQRSAREVQVAPVDLRHYACSRRAVRRLAALLRPARGAR